MDDEYTTPRDGGISDDSAALREFGERLGRFAEDICTAAGALDRLELATRRRVIEEIAARCGTFGDLAHDARRAVARLK